MDEFQHSVNRVLYLYTNIKHKERHKFRTVILWWGKKLKGKRQQVV